LAWTVRDHFSLLFYQHGAYLFHFFTVTKSFVILISEAVPKKILEVMNVDNISRESVASHLQVLFLLMLRSLVLSLSTILLLHIYFDQTCISAQLPSQTQFVFMPPELVFDHFSWNLRV